MRHGPGDLGSYTLGAGEFDLSDRSDLGNLGDLNIVSDQVDLNDLFLLGNLDELVNPCCPEHTQSKVTQIPPPIPDTLPAHPGQPHHE